jgi:DNA-binding NarL/FixJ family response regulator
MKTLLFVDDEPWFHESLRYALENLGFECVTATDMSSAMDLIRSRDISVVITDIMMPPGTDFPQIDSQETGFHLVKMVKRERPDTRIVCLSVIGDRLKIRELKRYAVEYIRKGEVPLSTAVETIERAAGQFRR